MDDDCDGELDACPEGNSLDAAADRRLVPVEDGVVHLALCAGPDQILATSSFGQAVGLPLDGAGDGTLKDAAATWIGAGQAYSSRAVCTDLDGDGFGDATIAAAFADEQGHWHHGCFSTSVRSRARCRRWLDSGRSRTQRRMLRTPRSGWPTWTATPDPR